MIVLMIFPGSTKLGETKLGENITMRLYAK